MKYNWMEADLIGLIWYIVKSICLGEVSLKSPRKKSGPVHIRDVVLYVCHLDH